MIDQGDKEKKERREYRRLGLLLTVVGLVVILVGTFIPGSLRGVAIFIGLVPLFFGVPMFWDGVFREFE